MIGIGEGDQRLIIGHGRAEVRGKFFGGQVVMKIGAGGIVNLLEQIGEAFAITQGKADGEVEFMVGGKVSGGLQALDAGRQMAVNGLPADCSAGKIHLRKQKDNEPENKVFFHAEMCLLQKY